MTEKPEGGNGQSLDGVVPPLSNEEFAELIAQFQKRGLPVIVYVFNGPDSVATSRFIQGASSRQMAAVATELDEWSRLLTRGHIASLQKSGIAKPGLIVPKT